MRRFACCAVLHVPHGACHAAFAVPPAWVLWQLAHTMGGAEAEAGCPLHWCVVVFPCVPRQSLLLCAPVNRTLIPAALSCPHPPCPPGMRWQLPCWWPAPPLCTSSLTTLAPWVSRPAVVCKLFHCSMNWSEASRVGNRLQPLAIACNPTAGLGVNIHSAHADTGATHHSTLPCLPSLPTCCSGGAGAGCPDLHCWRRCGLGRRHPALHPAEVLSWLSQPGWRCTVTAPIEGCMQRSARHVPRRTLLIATHFHACLFEPAPYDSSLLPRSRLPLLRPPLLLPCPRACALFSR